MGTYISTLPTLPLALLIGLCVFSTATLVFFGILRMSRHWGAALSLLSPQLLAVAAILYALFTGFLGNNIWNNTTQAQRVVAEEARALDAALLLSKGLQDDLRTAVRLWISDYVKAVTGREWASMAVGGIDDTPYAILYQALEAVTLTESESSGQAISQAKVVESLNAALAARTQRIQLSQERVGPIKWVVMLALGILVLTVSGLLHHANRITLAVSLVVCATGISSTLLPIVAYDRPFMGERAISPSPLKSLVIPKD
ncbi:MAG: DUF4239 domain-containing protein [Alphaproteobacteria bacterium]|nr:DUF4239 domain-containing protein [Alphaproteobacteria bacterium]